MIIRNRPDPRLKKDLLKLAFLFAALAAIPVVVAITPGLFLPSLLAVVLALLFSPLVVWFERRDFSRGAGIAIVFGSIAVVLGGAALWLGQTVALTWHSAYEGAPAFFAASLSRLTALEQGFKGQYPLLQSVDVVGTLTRWAQGTERWFITHGAALASDLVLGLVMTPVLALVLLQSGPSIQRYFFSLVPNRLFESSYIVSTRVIGAFSDYVRAKLLEATLVGVLCYVGFLIVHAPYPGPLALIAGVTNILPYVGPLIGAAACVLATALDPANAAYFWPVMIVYGVANIVDTFVIFPVVVAQLVNLHPLLVVVAVMVGQEYYGLVGMLVSVPLVTAAKIVIHEIHDALYRGGMRTIS